MTDSQKKHIVAMREERATYAAIADALDIPVSTIKTYCRRMGMTTDRTPSKPCCKNCGTELSYTPKTRPRLFCSDHCRQTWWNKHRRDRVSANIIPHICPTCGKMFTDYSGANRKYCSQECYRRNMHDGH